MIAWRCGGKTRKPALAVPDLLWSAVIWAVEMGFAAHRLHEGLRPHGQLSLPGALASG